jgi:hypothetical protein
LGSIVQKGKFALCAFAFDKQLKSVDFPTLGKPTIPAFIVLVLERQKYELKTKKSQAAAQDFIFLLKITVFNLPDA